MPKDYADVDLGERVRWNLGMVLIKGHVTAAPGGSLLTVYESWSEWVGLYQRSRDAYLADYARRFPDRVPGSERLLAAYQSSGEDGAAAERGHIAEESREDVRRVYANFQLAN